MPQHIVSNHTKLNIPALSEDGYTVKEICCLLGIKKTLVYKTLCYGFYPLSLFFQHTRWFPTHFLPDSLCLSFLAFSHHIRGQYFPF
jgi:hypothetical protein